MRNIVNPLALLATAVEDGLIRANPAAGLRLASSAGGGAAPVKSLTAQELAALIEQMPPEWQLLVRFLAHTGLRIGEAVALRWTYPVFASQTGTPIDSANPDCRVFKPGAQRAGVGWAGFHTLRHTAGTTFFRAGWNAKQVQMVLGHPSPAFTLETYVHLLSDDLPDPDFLDALEGSGRRRS